MGFYLFILGIQYDKSSEGWKALSRAARLCSRAEFKSGQEKVPILKRLVDYSKIEYLIYKPL